MKKRKLKRKIAYLTQANTNIGNDYDAMRNEVLRLREQISKMIEPTPSSLYAAQLGSQTVPLMVPSVHLTPKHAETINGVTIIEKLGGRVVAKYPTSRDGVALLPGDVFHMSLDLALQGNLPNG